MIQLSRQLTAATNWQDDGDIGGRTLASTPTCVSAYLRRLALFFPCNITLTAQVQHWQKDRHGSCAQPTTSARDRQPWPQTM
jgi:hypothetical protein